jgi:hypothetical protein
VTETKEKPFQEVANEQAHASIEHMREYLDDAIRSQRITEHALEVQVREAWHNPGEKTKPVEYFILLGTGGPRPRGLPASLTSTASPKRRILSIRIGSSRGPLPTTSATKKPQRC